LNFVAALRRRVRKRFSGFSNADNQQVAIMHKTLTMIVSGILTLLLVSVGVQAEEVSKAQLKGLDEQVQEIKSDVLAIATELNQLEEKLLYPSQTQVALFVALAEDETFRLDAVDLQLDGKPVAHHLYSYKELEALRMGGVQRLFTGNIRTGNHQLQVTLSGKPEGGEAFRRSESFTVQKDVGPRIVEITLARQSITFTNR
jgi:hypothetical protein